MGKNDNAVFRFLENRSRYADLFNGIVFQGEQVISADMLEPDSERYVLREGDAKEEVPELHSRFRDLKMRLKCGGHMAVVAVENQENVDFTMPLRMMEYDSLEYRKQVKEIESEKTIRQKEQGRKPCAWSTRLNQEDKLQPVYGLCLYHGTEEWDGPASLKDMMNFEGAPAGWQNLFHDYGMTLVCANRIEDFSVFKTELRQMLEVIPCRKDKKRLKTLMEREDYRTLDRDTAEVIAILTDNRKMLEYIEKQDEEVYDMCKALDDLVAEGRAEGRADILHIQSVLSEKLRADGLADEISRLFQPDFLEEMCKKYGVQM